jgi:hypothetical protein
LARDSPAAADGNVSSNSKTVSTIAAGITQAPSVSLNRAFSAL